MISLIFPTYNEESNLPELYKRLGDVTSKLPIGIYGCPLVQVPYDNFGDFEDVK